ncbi:MAG: acetate kinase [Mariprofundus sp.]|nr:acetate kinase [Mariprofundus sp.]
MNNDTPSNGLVLVINTGSSSIKMALLRMPSETTVAEGLLEDRSATEAILNWNIAGQQQQATTLNNSQNSIQQMLALLFLHCDKNDIIAVGHRVVHGGERFIKPTRIDATVIAELETLSHLAPLHNPANIRGIRAAMQALSDIPHIAVFDTAFHHNMPKHASLYAVPYHWYRDHAVRRYGFHGTSHHYVTQEAAICLGRELSDCQLLTAHLGNGCSATAIAAGSSIDTTMGFTPLEGLVMGTRSGDIDPGLHHYMAEKTGASLADITDILNRKSGLLGLSERSNDMRTLLQARADGDDQAGLAIDVFCYRLAKALAGLAIGLDHIDALIFTGGIGEHASPIRAQTVEHLRVLGMHIDEPRNLCHGQNSHGFISPQDATISILMIATDEEKMIARYVIQRLERQQSSERRQDREQSA